MKLPSLNPATEEVIASVVMSTPKEVFSAVQRAQQAFTSWKQLALEQRSSLVKKSILLLQQQRDHFAKLITQEMGKPIKESLREVDKSIELITYFCDTVQSCITTEKITLSSNITVHIDQVPRGVIAVIMPWNYPLSTPLWSIIPSLLTGNTVVFKPSEYTSLVGKELVIILNSILPKDVIHIIYGDADVGSYLVKAPVNMVAFVGSQNAGRAIMKNASEQLHKLVFELGGKAPALVCKDCNLEATAKGIVLGSLRNCGQVCNSIEKVYVEKGIEEKFIELVLAEVKKLKIGDGLEPDTDIGSLVNEQQLTRIKKQIKDAVRKGAHILYGGKQLDRKGYFFQPTVLTHVTEDMLVMSEETFGPVIPIKIVKTIDEAITMTNSSLFGLAATVWSNDLDKAQRIADQLQVGTIAINGIVRTSPQIPWGGMKQSGFGRMLGKEGIREYVQSKVTYLYR